jgi:hypothetical protein
VLRGLQRLELAAAPPSVLGTGALALAFLPSLATLVVTLDIPPACPEALRELPAGLRRLELANAWLPELPRKLADLTGEGPAAPPRLDRRLPAC